MSTVEIVVTGRVQKVGFRACVRKIATNLGIGGDVMNLTDGRVIIHATGETAILDKFVSMLYSCPRTIIRDLQMSPREDLEFQQFSVVRMPVNAGREIPQN